MSRWLRARWPLDRIAALALLVPTAPVIGVLAVLVRRADPGPGLVRLPRVGRQGGMFLMWKIRSMRTGGSDAMADGPSITGGADPRVTPLGRFLRRYRLDELPQLLNVIAGDMALIGPRPEAPAYVDGDDATWRAVLQAKPGIVGTTQLLVHEWESRTLGDDADRTYREVVLPVKLPIDAWYVRRATPWIDTLVVISLVQQFVLGCRVTALQARLARELPATRALGERSAPAPNTAVSR